MRNKYIMIKGANQRRDHFKFLYFLKIIYCICNVLVYYVYFSYNLQIYLYSIDCSYKLQKL